MDSTWRLIPHIFDSIQLSISAGKPPKRWHRFVSEHPCCPDHVTQPAADPIFECQPYVHPFINQTPCMLFQQTHGPGTDGRRRQWVPFTLDSAAVLPGADAQYHLYAFELLFSLLLPVVNRSCEGQPTPQLLILVAWASHGIGSRMGVRSFSERISQRLASPDHVQNTVTMWFRFFTFISLAKTPTRKTTYAVVALWTSKRCRGERW